MELYKQAKRLENENKWLEAAKIWKSINRTSDYDACMLIHESNIKGDEFRARVQEICGDEPDKCENPRAWLKWHEKLMTVK